MEEPIKENGSPLTTKKPRSKKQAEIDIDFTKALENDDLSDVFAPPKNPKTLLLPANRVPCNTTLPEDCHYQPEELVKLFLLPNVMVNFVPCVDRQYSLLLCILGLFCLCPPPSLYVKLDFHRPSPFT